MSLIYHGVLSAIPGTFMSRVLATFLKQLSAKKPYATQVRYMSHCDVLQPSGGNHHLSPTFTVPGTSRLSPTPPLTSGVLIWLLSCVQTIEDALATLTPPPYSVDVSIVLQSVRVRHNLKLDQETIELAIKSTGFGIVSLTPQDSPTPSLIRSGWRL